MPERPLTEKPVSPGELVAMSKEFGAHAVAYTYNEPTLQAEYIFAASPQLRDEGIATVMVTNGMFSREVCSEAASGVDAMNIDIKAFDEETYRRLGGSLDVVTRNVERLISAGVHIELTCLIVPGVSDSADGFVRLVDWMAGLSPDVPLHISRYFPSYRYKAPPTDISLMRRFFNAAVEKLNYVYLGNV
jgi:pyruvate formate lyase activating enzyme